MLRSPPSPPTPLPEGEGRRRVREAVRSKDGQIASSRWRQVAVQGRRSLLAMTYKDVGAGFACPEIEADHGGQARRPSPYGVVYGREQVSNPFVLTKRQGCSRYL